MRIEQLQYIVEIAKTGSITNTSEQLHLSAPGISQSIKGLEEELGVKVFDRSRTGLLPTEIGKEIITLAQEVLNKMEEMKEVANHHIASIEGNLSIAVINTLCRSIVPQTLASFKNKYPGINVKINEFSANSLAKKSVLNGDADIGLLALPPKFNEENKLLMTKHVLDSPLQVCFSNNSELAKRTTVNIKDIVHLPIAAYSNNSETIDYFNSFSKFGKLNILFQSNSPETRNYFISQGLAIGFDCALATRFDYSVKNGNILAVPLSGLESDVSKLSFYCIHLKSQHLSFAAKEFLKEVQNQSNNLEEDSINKSLIKK
ncbi:LysR family transcriptional regulator [Gottfriedia sp. NPDC058432]|uniref:LysR family transcriptional regulator n=1 Tax=Gottfriedia sp. NPDC058432 TaxID=3346497 RepID=UPI00365A8FF4